MRSKALVRFLNRAARFDEDLELVSVVGLAVGNGHLTPECGSPIYTGVERGAHPRLARAKATDHNRQLVFGHLRKTLYASYIKDLYEDFVDYLDELVCSAMRRGLPPSTLRGEYKVQLNADDLLECQSWDAALDVVGAAVSRRFRDMGTVKTITFFDKRLRLGLDSSVVKNAVCFLDLRHLLVHEDGVAHQQFCTRYPDFDARPGESVRLDEGVASEARRAITALVEHMDACAVSAACLDGADLH